MTQNPTAPVGPPVGATVALVLFSLAGAFVAVSYGIHWWRAADPETYATSARLIEWVKPEPGKWRSLAYEGLLAAIVAIVSTACVVPGFQAWNGWRWSRWAGLLAIALAGGYTALMNWWAAPAIGLTLLGSALLFLPPMTRAFREFGQHRATGRPAYRRPERIFYGRLPRFR